jgi:hypothetical protein
MSKAPVNGTSVAALMRRGPTLAERHLILPHPDRRAAEPR